MITKEEYLTQRASGIFNISLCYNMYCNVLKEKRPDAKVYSIDEFKEALNIYNIFNQVSIRKSIEDYYNKQFEL